MSENLYASSLLHWPQAITNLEEKQAVAARVLEQVADGQLIGIGSGSSTYLVLWEIGRRVAEENLRVQVMCSSIETEAAARTLGLDLVRQGSARPDWGVDGADEVDPAGRLIKGRGGAMFREKLLWFSSRRMFLAADPSKFVDALGVSFPIPVEVHRDAVEIVARELDRMGAAELSLRVATGKDGPVITEEGHLILDAHFSPVAEGLSAQIKVIPGVIETGLFEGYRFERL